MGSVAETLSFLLDQVESVSKDAFDPDACRPIKQNQWQKAADFKKLLTCRDGYVQAVPHDDGRHGRLQFSGRGLGLRV